ncbi:MAG: uridine diphosphate-N-acetylglucosamine-binding protein YvcK [Planctomycetes bacterium]|nr:uridine diphosphate-N-acetylglucosamine-binding protein YvcK [Planctomycetota bacterium]
MRSWRWLLPGLRLKRWVLVASFGAVFLVLGAIFLGLGMFKSPMPGENPEGLVNFYTTAGILIGLGVILVFTGVYRLVRTTEKLLRKGEKRGITEIAYDQARRELGPRVVCLGGGHGLSTLLTGLKTHPVSITAVVSMADDGGSSGRLRKDFDILPPGDIRNCLVALADAGPVMRDLMQHRFTEGEFAGHSFGNLFIYVLSQIREDFGQAILESNRILSVRGMVLPATLDRVSLVATHPDGSKSTGQRVIAQCGKPIEGLELKPQSGSAPPDVLEALKSADLIVFGPGSLYTSVLPTLLEEDIASTITKSQAVKLFIINTMCQPGETDGFTVAEYLQAVEKIAPGLAMDAILVNSYRPSAVKLESHQNKGEYLTEYDRKGLAQLPVRVFLRDVIDLEQPSRHDPEKLSAAVLEIFQQLRTR